MCLFFWLRWLRTQVNSWLQPIMREKDHEVNDDVPLHAGGCGCHEQHFHYWCILCPHILEGNCVGIPSLNYRLMWNSGCNGYNDAKHEVPALVSCLFSFPFLPTRFGSYMVPGKQDAHGLRFGLWCFRN